MKRKYSSCAIKKCTGPCGRELEVCADNFPWRNESNTWRNKCKECVKEYNKKYDKTNRERIIEYRKKHNSRPEIKKHKQEYYKKYCTKPENKERRKERHKEYYEKNKEQILEKQKEYYANLENRKNKKGQNKKYYEENKKIINKQNKKYYEENKSQVLKQCKEYKAKPEIKKYNKKQNKKYYEKNKKRINKRNKNRIKSDPIYAIRIKFSRMFSKAIKNNDLSKNGQSTFKILGYSKQQLKEHIESQFESWMNWNNWGKYNPETWDDNNPSTWTWHIDHIIPQSHLLYDSFDHSNFKKCWALENLRPFSAKQNILDGNRR